MSVISIQAHPGFARNGNVTVKSNASDLEDSLIKGITANVRLIEATLQQFSEMPNPDSLRRIINARITVNRFLTDLESDESDFIFASPTFVEQYQELKGQLAVLVGELEIAAATYVPPAQQPVQIVIAPETPTSRFWQVVGIIVMVTVGFTIMGIFH